MIIYFILMTLMCDSVVIYRKEKLDASHSLGLRGVKEKKSALIFVSHNLLRSLICNERRIEKKLYSQIFRS